MKNQKKRKKNIDDKIIIDATPTPDAPVSDTPNAYAQDVGCTDSNYSYSLRNRKFVPYSATTMTNQKKK